MPHPKTMISLPKPEASEPSSTPASLSRFQQSLRGAGLGRSLFDEVVRTMEQILLAALKIG